MPIPVRLVFLPVLLCAAACSRTPTPATPIPGLGPGDGEMAWGGLLPCADCNGIDTRLVLRREGEQRRYRLIETYRAEDSDARFVEQGAWRQARPDGLLLTGDDGARHAFALVADGRLQPRDDAGRPFFGRDDDLLAPLASAQATP